MKLNVNSTSSKLYCWFYGKPTDELPNSLCPYFWKLVLAYILVIPFSILTAPHILLFEVFSKNYKNGDSQTMERIGNSMTIYILLFVLLILGVGIGFIFINYDENGLFYHMVPISILLWFTSIVAGVLFGIKYLINRISENKYKMDSNGYLIKKEKRPSIVVEFVKAKYNSYCPKIEWVKKDK